MFLRKQAKLVFKGSPNPCFAYKNFVFISKAEVFISKGKLAFLAKANLPLLG